MSNIVKASIIAITVGSLSMVVSSGRGGVSCSCGTSSMGNDAIILSCFSNTIMGAVMVDTVLLATNVTFSYVSNSDFPRFARLLGLCKLIVLNSISTMLVLVFITSFFGGGSACTTFGALVSITVNFMVNTCVPIDRFSSKIRAFMGLVPNSRVTTVVEGILIDPYVGSVSASLTKTSRKVFTTRTRGTFTAGLGLFKGRISFAFVVVCSVNTVLLFLILGLVSCGFDSGHGS